MDYLSAEEFAERWSMDVRIVLERCKAGRIPGACEQRAKWLIPMDAHKPQDAVTGDERSPSALYPGLFLMETIRLDGRSAEMIAAELPSDAHRRQFWAEMAYLQGDFDRALELLTERPEGDNLFDLCALHVRNISHINKADYPAFVACMNEMDQMYTQRLAYPEEATCIELSQMTAITSLYAAERCPEWLRNCDFRNVPADAHLYAVYVYARYIHSRGQSARMLGAVESALSLSRGSGITISELYLQIMRGVALVELNQPLEARKLMREVFELVRPYGIYIPFSENMSTLRGEMDAALKEVYPDEYKLVLQGWKRVFNGWVEIHNRITNENIPTLLTLKEHQIGLYLCEGLSYKEIAARMGLRLPTINNYMQAIRDKLGVRTSAEVVQRIRWR